MPSRLYTAANGSEVLLFDSRDSWEPFTLLPPGPGGIRMLPHMTPSNDQGQGKIEFLVSPEGQEWFARMRRVRTADLVGGVTTYAMLAAAGLLPVDDSEALALLAGASVELPEASGLTAEEAQLYGVGSAGGVGYVGTMIPGSSQPGPHPFTHLSGGAPAPAPPPEVAAISAEAKPIAQARALQLVDELKALLSI